MRRVLTPVLLALAAGVASACGSAAPAGTAGDGSGSGPSSRDDRPTIVVTTTVLGDIVTAALGDLADDEIDVEVIMPIGADPHDFAPSARQAEAMETADLLVVNGLGFEERMLDIIDSVAASGTPLFVVSGSLRTTADTIDPHVWMDPNRMADAFAGFGSAVAAATDLDPTIVDASVSSYVDQLRTLDATITARLSTIPAENRVLVTNHDSLEYFAARYDLDVIGTIIPSVSTSAQASASGLHDLAALITARDIPAIFVETTESGRLAESLAAEMGGQVEVVELYTGSLGEPGSGADTYLGFMTIDADRIAAALN